MKLSPFAGRQPVFLGDDTSDENGFEAINEAGGVSIMIKPQGPTAASSSLAGVTEAIAWLEQCPKRRQIPETCLKKPTRLRQAPEA